MHLKFLDGRRHLLSAICVWLILLAGKGWGAPGGSKLLWEIGKADNDNREFALAPKGYGQFREDGFFVVGRSDPKRDWPYVHPGPHDSWAGGRPHTFYIVYGLKTAPAEGDCKLLVDLIDTQSQSRGQLRIEINGKAYVRKMPLGAGDASVFGQPAKGKEHRFDVVFPAGLLRAGANEIGITTVSGSWVLYDWIGLETPPGAELGEARGTIVSSLRAPPVLVERGGKLCQTVETVIRHFGEATEAVVRVDGKAATNLVLRSGSHRVELPLAAVEKERSVTVEVDAGGKTLGRQTAQLKPVRKWVVYLLPHSHVDIGYTHVQTDVERAQWRYLETAIETARRTAGNPAGARFKWNVEVLWAVDSYLKQASPEKQQEFLAAVKAGWVGLQALYGNELTGLCRPEELLRLLGCAQRMSERCGVPIESAMITDVPGYTWGVVPAFAQGGVKYFSIGPNGGDRIGHTIAAWGDKPFWWVGPNGRDKVLVWMTGTGYYQVFQTPDKLMEYLGRLEEKQYPYNFVQVRHCLGDNGAPDVNFADKVKAWNETHAYPKLIIATSEEMFRDFEARYGSEIPSARGDFTPYWEDGAASSARETALNRGSAERLVQAEALFAMLDRQGYPGQPFYEAWRNVILYDEHTWGAHNSISQPDNPFVKSQWAIKQAFALEGERQSRKLLEQVLASRGAPARSTRDGLGLIDVFNTTGFEVKKGLVLAPEEWSRGGNAVVAADGTVLPGQRLSSGELVFEASVKPFSAQRFEVARSRGFDAAVGSAKADRAVLETAALRVQVDEKTGAVVSLRYKPEGVELVDAKGLKALNDYVYLPGSDVKGIQRNGPVKISVKERGPLVAALVIESEAPGCKRLLREIRVQSGRAAVEVIDLVDKQAVRTKEGVHFGFGFNVPGGVARMDIPWAIVRPETDQIAGACKNWFTVQHWVDISNDKYGVMWLTPDAPLVEIGRLTANLIGSLPDPRVWMEHIEPSQTIYSWAMNNHWHTNYRAEQDGPTVFRYVICPHGGSFRAERAAQLGIEISQPLVVAPARGEARGTPLVELTNGKVMISALKPSEDGKGWIVRLFGISGQDQQTELKWAGGENAFWLSDLSEQRRKQVDGPIEVPGYGIVTVRVENR